MTRFESVLHMFNSFSFPVEFDHVTGGKLVPFAVYTYSMPNIGADNKIYLKSIQFMLRVFVEKLDAKIDKEIEDAFENNDIAWNREEPTYIDDAALYEIDYSFGIISE